MHNKPNKLQYFNFAIKILNIFYHFLIGKAKYINECYTKGNRLKDDYTHILIYIYIYIYIYILITKFLCIYII